MIEACRSENKNRNDHRSVAIEARKPYQVLCYLLRTTVTGLIPSIMWSHEKHFIVMSHNGHVTIKWAGRAATLPTLKGGRNHGRKRLLTAKMREDNAF